MKFKQLKKVLPTIQKAYCGRPAGSLSARVAIMLRASNHQSYSFSNIDAPELEEFKVKSVDVTKPTAFPTIIVTLYTTTKFVRNYRAQKENRMKEHSTQSTSRITRSGKEVYERPTIEFIPLPEEEFKKMQDEVTKPTGFNALIEPGL
jgi:hypothetical protein